MNFADRLDDAVARAGHPLLLGIDPHLDLLPDAYAAAREPDAPRVERAAALAEFGKELVELAAGRVAAVKPQAAFFEQLGADGWRAWEAVLAHAREHELLVIADVKRGDVPSTAKAYARAHLGTADTAADEPVADAITVNPYLGEDAMQPFVEACAATGRGLFVLVRTSNPGSGLFQEHGRPALAHVVAEAVSAWGEPLRGDCGFSSVGAVVGATHADELARLRAAMPHTPLLLPGLGAQGATAADCRAAFPDPAHPWRGGLINSSRGIAFAYRRPEHAGRSWQDAARHALDATIAELRDALGLAPCGRRAP